MKQKTLKKLISVLFLSLPFYSYATPGHAFVFCYEEDLVEHIKYILVEGYKIDGVSMVSEDTPYEFLITYPCECDEFTEEEMAD